MCPRRTYDGEDGDMFAVCMARASVVFRSCMLMLVGSPDASVPRVTQKHGAPT